MPSKQDNVASMARYRHRDTRALLDYLYARLETGQLQGLVVHSLDGGCERMHTTGTYATDRKRATTAVVVACIRMSAAQ